MASLRRAERAQRIRSLLLVLPAIVFLLVVFVLPILSMLVVAVENRELREVMPRTAAAITAWDGSHLPPPATVATFVEELRQAAADGSIGKVARRLNYNIPGFRSVLLRTGRSLPSRETPDAALLPALVGIDPHWEQPEYWLAMKRAAPAVTDFYLLGAADLRRDARGTIVRVPPDQAVFATVFGRTFWVSLVVTAVCLLLGYPIAHLLASLPARRGNILMILVLLPFWTSVLVRTTAWLVLLQREGVVNDLAVRLGLTTARIELVHNRFGVYVAMVHILLPFMVLPIYAVLRRIPSHAHARGRHAGGRAVPRVPEGLLPPEPARGDWRLPAGVHPGARLLRDAGAGRRRVGPVDQLLHRPLRQRDRQLGNGGSLECDPSRDRDGLARPSTSGSFAASC